ncbi:MAG TPA: Sir2 family NAD-dependent protein deacetylase [Polyangiaceae bacterium]|nr:Sir2 family NAD-dependent protein deacetylase [Polyangiaceae bacterium]
MLAEVAHFSELLGRAERILAFTGAGISTASNIPDFRGPDGVWRTRTPVELPAFLRSEEARIEYWSWKLEGYPAFRDARPNDAHLALVTLEERGKLEAVVTQNVDGLHRAAGTSAERLVELHGTNSEAVCLGCAVREPVKRCMDEFAETQRPPLCKHCGELMKPGVVMFGQALEAGDLRRANAAAGRADLVIALGSSLVVTPAANVPLVALRRRVPYVIVNRGATPHDELATLTIDGDVGVVLSEAVRAAFS